MIEIKNLEVGINDKQILDGVSLNFEKGKNYCLLGKNGSGKSTLSSFLMGNPKYELNGGTISIDGKNLIEMDPEDRSKEGIFLSFQNVPEIGGIKLGEYLRIITNISMKNNDPSASDLSPFIFKRYLKKYLEELKIDEKFLERDLNVGFSGGEKRKIEILQMKLIGPKYIILDEIDSGLDLDAFRDVASMLQNISNENNSLIIITHYFKILEYVDVDKVFVMKNGKIVKDGDKDLASYISNNGFEEF